MFVPRTNGYGILITSLFYCKTFSHRLYLRYAKQNLGVANGNDFATCHRKPVCLRVTKLYVTSWKITTFFLSEICAATARITVESGVLNVFHGFKKCKIRCFLYLYHKMLVEVIEMVDQPGVQSKITRPSSAQILVVVAQINFEPHPGFIRNKLCHPAPHAGQIQPHRMHRSTHLEGEPSMWDIEMSLIQSKHDITALTIFML